MMTKGEKSKLNALCALLALAAVLAAVSGNTAFERRYRTRIAALENAISQLEISATDGTAPHDMADAGGKDAPKDAFSLSTAMRKSMVESGFAVTMEKTEANGVAMQARSGDAQAVMNFLRGLLAGKVPYGIKTLSVMKDSKGNATMEITSDVEK